MKSIFSLPTLCIFLSKHISGTETRRNFLLLVSALFLSNPILLTAMKLTESDIRNFYTADEIETTVTVCYDLTTRINKTGNGASSKEAEVYDLAGRKVEKPVQKGVYIVGGHKLLKR